MSASITRVSGDEAYTLIRDPYLSQLSPTEQESMQRAMANSPRCWIGYDDDLVLGVWGLIPPTLLSNIAYLWLFTTPHLHQHTFMFIRHSQRAVEEMLHLYPTIVGHAKIGADKSIRWLEWLGAKFGPAENTFIPFEIKAKHTWPQQLAL